MGDSAATAGYKLFNDDSNTPPSTLASLETNGAMDSDLLLNSDAVKLMSTKVGLAHASHLRYGRALLPLAIIQICLGGIAVAANAIAIAETQDYYKIVGIDGSGIWGGIISIAAGVCGFIVHKKSSGCGIIAYLVLSVIAATAAGIAVAFSSFWMPSAEHFAYYGYSSYGYGRHKYGSKAPLIGLATVITAALANVVASAVSASLMCVNAPCCCGNASSSASGVKTVYVAVPIAIPMSTITGALSRSKSKATYKG